MHLRPLKPASGRSLPFRTAQRGLSLIEALVAFAVMACGMLGALSWQTSLRSHADLARQQTEAVRLAQEQMETLRSGSALDADGGSGPDAVESRADDGGSRFEVPGVENSNTEFVVERVTTVHRAPDYVATQVRVSWPASHGGEDASVVLQSVIASIDPSLSGRLMAPPARVEQSHPLGRHGLIPREARNLGDGRSGLLPSHGAAVAWIFDNHSGVVTSLCSVPPSTTQLTLDLEDLSACVEVKALTVSGHVRFSTGASVSNADAERPTSLALDLDMALSLSAGSGAQCHDDAESGSARQDVAYRCLVVLEAGQWSGQVQVVPRGWRVGTGAGEFSVCRYSADWDGDGRISNAEHPSHHSNVKSTLAHQNFLVIQGGLACPTDGPARPALGDFVNSNTEPL